MKIRRPRRLFFIGCLAVTLFLWWLTWSVLDKSLIGGWILLGWLAVFVALLNVLMLWLNKIDAEPIEDKPTPSNGPDKKPPPAPYKPPPPKKPTTYLELARTEQKYQDLVPKGKKDVPRR